MRTFDTNIHSFFRVSKFSLPHMRRGSTMINNASINAYIGRPDLLDYTSTKGAVVSFTRGLSNQYLGKGIRVNAIAPGPGERATSPVAVPSSASGNLVNLLLWLLQYGRRSSQPRRTTGLKRSLPAPWAGRRSLRRSPHAWCFWHHTTVPASAARPFTAMVEWSSTDS